LQRKNEPARLAGWRKKLSLDDQHRILAVVRQTPSRRIVRRSTRSSDDVSPATCTVTLNVLQSDDGDIAPPPWS
jgi:hypothetical protein